MFRYSGCPWWYRSFCCKFKQDHQTQTNTWVRVPVNTDYPKSNENNTWCCWHGLVWDPGWRFVDSKRVVTHRLFMLPTVLRRWSWYCFYFVWLCVFTTSLALLFVVVCFQSFKHLITSHGEERAGTCASRAFVCLFCTRWFFFFFVFFSSSWCQGLAAACGCGTTRTFLSTFFFWCHVKLYSAVNQVPNERQSVWSNSINF